MKLYQQLSAIRTARDADARMWMLWTLGVLGHRTRRAMVIDVPKSTPREWPRLVDLQPAPREPSRA